MELIENTIQQILYDLGEGEKPLKGWGNEEKTDAEVLEEVYYSEKGFVGPAAMKDVVKRETGRNISLDKIRQFIANQGIHQITTRKNRVTSHHYNIQEPHELHEADLLYLDLQSGMKYLLGVIDGYSRYLCVIPLAGRNAKDVLTGLKILYGKDSPFIPPKTFSSDGGGEFENKQIDEFFAKNGVRHYIRRKGKHARLIERVFLTIQRPLYHYRDAHLKTNWSKFIDGVVTGYNTRTHTTLKMSPKEALESETQVFAEWPKLPKSDKHHPVFKVYDKVRIAYPVEGKRRAVDFTFSDETYEITSVTEWNDSEDDRHPNFYKVSEQRGVFHEDELIKATYVENPIQADNWKKTFG